MIFKYELRFVAFRRPNFFPCGRNLVYGICKLKPENLKTYFLVKKKTRFLPALAESSDARNRQAFRHLHAAAGGAQLAPDSKRVENVFIFLKIIVIPFRGSNDSRPIGQNQQLLLSGRI